MKEHSGEELIGVKYEARTGICTRRDYERLYRESLANPAAFWAKFAEEFHWYKKARLGLC